MCKDNLGNCGCGCNKCGSSSAHAKPSGTRTASIKTSVPPLQPSGYTKKSAATATTAPQSSFFSKKTSFSPSSLVTSDEVLEPEVEVMEPEYVTTKNDNTGAWIAGIGFGLMLLLAGKRDKKT